MLRHILLDLSKWKSVLDVWGCTKLQADIDYVQDAEEYKIKDHVLFVEIWCNENQNFAEIVTLKVNNILIQKLDI